MLQRILLFTSLLALLFTGSAVQRSPNVVHGLSNNFTIPTRTPTPKPPDPTSPPSNPDPTATTEAATNVPPTETAVSVQVTVAATPVGGFLPTAEPCADHPTVQGAGATNVRSGPGIDYATIGELLYLEVRPIIGRAADAKWWQILLGNGETGYVSNAIIISSGNISVIPIVPSPLINGVAPTPGTPWQPVIDSECTISPTWTSTPNPTPTTEVEPEPVLITEEPTVESVEIEETAVSSPEPITPTDTPQPISTAIPSTPEPIATAVPLDEVTPTSGSSSFLPIVGGILLAAGGLVAILRKRS